MFKFTIRKLLVLVPKLLIITIVLFLALEALPGDPLSRTMNPKQYHELTEAQKDSYREALGLNDPPHVRYLHWLGNLLQGDLGYSTSTGQKISEMLANRLPYTMELTAYSLVIAAILGVAFGFMSAVWKNSLLDRLSSAISVVGISLPDFFFGIVWMLLFGVILKWFPSGGRMSTSGDMSFLARLPYMVLPVWTMTFNLVAALLRYVRSCMLDTIQKDYMKTARSKGLSETTVNLKHGLRTSMTPVMTMLVMRLPMLVGGSVVIETVFSYPGVGTMTFTALSAGDVPVVLIGTLLTGALVLIASTLVDLFTALLDPRVRME